MTEPNAAQQLGTLAQEAGQLLDAVTARLTAMRSPSQPATADAAPTHTCLSWCPICRGAELLHGDTAEVSQKVVDTLLAVLVSVRALIPDQGAPRENTAPAETPGIERIDIR